MSQKIPPEIKQQIDEFAAKMMEHCDSIRIFVTLHDGNSGNTHSYDTGKGNIHAQHGQVMEFLEIQQQYMRNYAIRKDGEDFENGK